MGIRKEIERLQSEKQVEKEILEQKRLRVVERINERVDFLNEQARVRIRPYLRTLQQSGAIDVLRELNEEMGLKREVGIVATISYPIRDRKWPDGNFLSMDEIRGPCTFYGEDLEGGWEYQESGYYPDEKRYLKAWLSVEPRKIRILDCRASLQYYYREIRGNPEDAGVNWFKERSLLFYSLGQNQPVKLVREITIDDSYRPARSYSEVFYFPKKHWGNKELLNKMVAKAYLGS